MMRSSSAGISGFSASGGDRRAIQDRFENYAGGFAAEGQRAGGHFVEHDAEGKKIGARVEFLGANLFGRHVGHGAERGAGAGEMLGVNAAVRRVRTVLAGKRAGRRLWRGRNRESWRGRVL